VQLASSFSRCFVLDGGRDEVVKLHLYKPELAAWTGPLVDDATIDLAVNPVVSIRAAAKSVSAANESVSMTM
jgi:hypothetical protein